MNDLRIPIRIFGAKIKNKQKLLSSQSGGAFTAVAETFLKSNAVIYGCGMDENLDAVYMRITDPEELGKIQGSKYVQARLKNAYQDIQKDLDEGKTVLFSGTPCYANAMKRYFKNHRFYKNFYTADLICHGVPSPKVYHAYLKYLEKKQNSPVRSFVFRDKTCQGGGWHKHIEKVTYADDTVAYEEGYTKLFYTNLPLRPSCGNCRFSCMSRTGDFTVGDYWGVEQIFPEFHDDQGVSLIFLNTKRAAEMFPYIRPALETVECREEQAAVQSNLKQPSHIPKCRKRFWNDFHKKGIAYCIRHWSTAGGLSFRIRRKVMKLLKLW